MRNRYFGSKTADCSCTLHDIAGFVQCVQYRPENRTMKKKLKKTPNISARSHCYASRRTVRCGGVPNRVRYIGRSCATCSRGGGKRVSVSVQRSRRYYILSALDDPYPAARAGSQTNYGRLQEKHGAVKDNGKKKKSNRI